MKKYIFITVVCFFFSCEKTDSSILEKPEFKELVGTWLPVKKEDNSKKLNISSSGKVEMYFSTGRGKRFTVNNIDINNYDFLVEGRIFNQRFLRSTKKNNLLGSVTIYKQKNADTTWIAFGYTENNFIQDTTGADFFYKVK
ncbi:MAG: hypothetical protein ACK5B9_15945 [Flavobacteriia bacterium]|jgi:hypothetical protein